MDLSQTAKKFSQLDHADQQEYSHWRYELHSAFIEASLKYDYETAPGSYDERANERAEFCVEKLQGKLPLIGRSHSWVICPTIKNNLVVMEAIDLLTWQEIETSVRTAEGAPLWETSEK